jgi:polyphosphate kinase
VFDEIRRADVLVHQPYESFRSSFEAFAQAAASDPSVIAIKTTVYRTSDDSALVSALVECAEQGKQSVCLVELKARGDERRNIEWSRAMEQAGVHVVHGFADLKIHAKMTLVVRREEDGLRRYVHIGTGNYNAATARMYEDLGFFTADKEIAADVADLFNYLTGFGRPQRFRKLLVAPIAMRSRLLEEIRRVAAAAAAGERTRIRIKLNQLVDPAMIEELYAASQAGVPIEICARAICMLRPGVEGLSETIKVRSIFGRFLEHSRIYAFETGDQQSMFIGSADLMPRNLDRRIEVLAPIEGARVRVELNSVLDSVFADNTCAWELGAEGTWTRLAPADGAKPYGHQTGMQRRVTTRVRRRREGRNRGQ